MVDGLNKVNSGGGAAKIKSESRFAAGADGDTYAFELSRIGGRSLAIFDKAVPTDQIPTILSNAGFRILAGPTEKNGKISYNVQKREEPVHLNGSARKIEAPKLDVFEDMPDLLEGGKHEPVEPIYNARTTKRAANPALAHPNTNAYQGYYADPRTLVRTPSPERSQAQFAPAQPPKAEPAKPQASGMRRPAGVVFGNNVPSEAQVVENARGLGGRPTYPTRAIASALNHPNVPQRLNELEADLRSHLLTQGQPKREPTVKGGTAELAARPKKAAAGEGKANAQPRVNLIDVDFGSDETPVNPPA
jgi:hypothetical protein